MLIDSEGEAERPICSIVHEAERRRRCLEAFAEAVREAHYHSEGLWAVTCSEDKVRLQVGPIIICNLGDKSARTERLWLALDRDSLASGGKEALLESFGEWEWSEKVKNYVAIPTRNGYYVPSERHEEIWKEIKEHHFEAIRKAAQRGGLRSKTKEGHSPGVLEYIRNALGRNLPDPIYAT